MSNHKHDGCIAPDCTEPHKARGYCNLHYARMHRTGTFDARPYGTDQCGYAAAHRRLRYDKGKASNYVCECGAPAQEWAYLHGSAKELTEQRKIFGKLALVAYSPDPDDYAPMCIPCHRTLDKSVSVPNQAA